METGSGTPRHVGIIPDGNRRWAQRRGEPTAAGHLQGAAKVVEVLGWCEAAGIKVATVYMLSSTNVARSAAEDLPRFIELAVARLVRERKFRFRLIGRPELVPVRTRTVLTSATEQVSGSTSLLVNLAVGYSGRDDILAAVHAFLRARNNGTTDTESLIEQLTVEEINRHVSTAGQPDPDLIIRTSGEQRLSGFLTWQAEQAEFHFCSRYWPEFRLSDFERALHFYARGHRRFGR
jgi:short-chain Z-isoprenyl diphosphate synthase